MIDMDWEGELADLLGRLNEAQQRLFDLLSRKRELLIARNHIELAALGSEEVLLCAELQACHDRRQELLADAAAVGMPSDSIRSLASQLPAKQAKGLQQPLDEAQRRSHLLRHHCMSQWVAVQRTMLHLSHLIEIIATGGQLKPTYGKGVAPSQSGTLMDQAV
ncbi:flagellar export chaperone FlgN [Bythopirellula polymerisocia]|uniref:FlgN protein n=1 Tax=Bythopirellula polymerisocia TaxID=2528003 RepID=A0A5C6CL07_9BACT|nr:flagellar export chaperone FlgN [Bythopirellula polymerisocia]TWU25553.1 FlgN protein [Bythopirellula polymerisocia]